MEPFNDLMTFAQNAKLLLDNADLILSDCRLFMSPIDMGCGLAISGRFKPTTLGAYIEWWTNCPESRDSAGNPVLRLAGSGLSSGNLCTVAGPTGELHSVTLSKFSAAWHSFISASERYRHAMCKSEAYPLEKVIDLLRHKSI